MSATQTAIPYEEQSAVQSGRTCGAACLSMVYRSFGAGVPQTEIWPAISKPNRFGTVSSTTYLMTQDALARGFKAVAIQARHPLQVLRICRDAGIRAILNHRLRRDTAAGHYSVLVNIDDQGVVLHDPLLGPSRRLALRELLELWLPYFANSEIGGNMLIAVAPADSREPSACDLCHAPIKDEVACPQCKKHVKVQPTAVLGCFSESCIARMWNSICCPWCDYTWNPVGGPAAARRTDAAEAPNVTQMFAEIDKFCNHILSIPVAAAHPEIRKQLDFISAGKDKFRLAYAEQLAHRQVRETQLNAMVEEAKQKAEEQRMAMEEINKPLPPLDGNALGAALLKNLGLTS